MVTTGEGGGGGGGGHTENLGCGNRVVPAGRALNVVVLCCCKDGYVMCVCVCVCVGGGGGGGGGGSRECIHQAH